jgi:hypothetical protein
MKNNKPTFKPLDEIMVRGDLAIILEVIKNRARVQLDDGTKFTVPIRELVKHRYYIRLEQPKEPVDLNDEESKGYIGFWREAIFRSSLTNWSVILKPRPKGKSQTISLKTPDQAVAATRARNTYLSIQANGWERTMETLRLYGWAEQNLVPVWRKPDEVTIL